MESLQDRWNLNGKRSLVTGATKGIGLAIAEEFLALGAEVFIVARNQDELDDRLNTWQQQKLPVIGFTADVSKPDDRQRLAEAVTQRWGNLDILVNNAGTNIRKKTVDYASYEYDFLMDTNLGSTFYLNKLFYPLLKDSSQGNIVNISSVAGLTHMRTGSIYGMSKAALIQLTKNLAAEWAEDNIRVNAVAPWYTDTPLARTVLQDDNYLQDVLVRTPLKKIGRPEDVAAAAAFLCMPAAAYITGHCIAVDGGFSIYGF